MSVYKDSKTGRWYVDYRYQGYRIRYPAGDSKREADQLKSRITLEINAGTHDPERTKARVRGRSVSGPTFGEAVTEFLRDYVPRSGRNDYYVEQSKVWLRFFHGKLVAAVLGKDVVEMLSARLRQVNPSTARKEVVSLGTFFRWARRAGYIANNPADAESVARPAETFDPQQIRWLSSDELVRLKDACPTWLRRLVIWAFETGMDRGKIRRLRWQELDLERVERRIAGGRFAIQRDKTGMPVRQELAEGAVEALNQASRTRHTSGVVFLNAEGQPINENALEWALNKAYREAGITGCNFRTFRHTFATRAMRRGVPREVVAKMMGHSAAFITERYMHVADDQLKAAAKALSGPERLDGSNGTVVTDAAGSSTNLQTPAKILHPQRLSDKRRGTEVVATGPPRKRVGD